MTADWPFVSWRGTLMTREAFEVIRALSPEDRAEMLAAFRTVESERCAGSTRTIRSSMADPLSARSNSPWCPECRELLHEQFDDDGDPFWVCGVCSAAFDAEDLDRYDAWEEPA